jgi:hypothetical protein
MIKKIKDNNIGYNPIKAWQSRAEFSSKKPRAAIYPRINTMHQVLLCRARER